MTFAKYKKHRFVRTQRGFSFLEVMISLFVLSIGFLGVINLATATLRNSMLQRDAVIASMLVQEGAELVYNIRDTNLARGNTAFAGFTDGSFKIDYKNPSFSGCSDFNSCQLNAVVSGSNTFYGYDPNAPKSKFSRKILVSTGGTDREITSVVVWGKGVFPVGAVNGTSCTTAGYCSFAKTQLQEE